MKEVAYRGGIIAFAIPDGWVEENGPDGGAAYYADTPGSGTLRLNVTTLQPPESVEARHVLETAASGAEPQDPSPQLLSNGNALRTFWREGFEDGTPVQVRYWALAGAVPPTTVRLTLFSFTTFRGEADESIPVLDAELPRARFTDLTAEQVRSKIAAARRPWWKLWSSRRAPHAGLNVESRRGPLARAW